MAGKTPEQEPSIEEILASIRQIISDDEPERDAAVDLSAKEDDKRDSNLDLSAGPEEKFVIPVAAPEPEKPAPKGMDVLDLTNEVVPEPKTISYAEEKDEMPTFEPDKKVEVDFMSSDMDDEPVQASRHSDLDLSLDTPKDDIFSNAAANATASAFSRLIGNIPVEREENTNLFMNGRITLEDIVRDMLRPMLRQWVDENVPGLVERLVEKELEKLARQARED